MAKHFDIGMVGCWYWGNYGSLLNGYATHEILKSLGLKPLNIVTPNNGFEPHTKKFFQAVYTKDEISDVLPFDRLKEFNDVCDMFLTGSDQIWKFNSSGDRNYDKFFRLDFADEDKRKVSFATSLGNYNPEPKELKDVFQKLYNRYDAISLREHEGVNIFKKKYQIKATQVLEPVLAVPKECWYKLAEYSEYEIKSPYLLTYILDPTEKKRNAIIYYANKLGVKAVNILDGFSGIYNQNKNKLHLPNTLPNIWCADLLKHYMNAEFVITDSFHGMCFALIFNKPFIVIGNHLRGIQRFQSVLENINMMDRLIQDPENIPLDLKFLENMDFTNANEIIMREGKRSTEWLKKSLETPRNSMESIKIKDINGVLDEELCMGCGACVSICPVNAIHLGEDKYGVYRAKVDKEKCIQCGKCKKVCSALELPVNLNSSNPLSYAFISSDLKTRMESSSGGAFTAIAKTILSKGGVVVGAAWKDDFSVEHIVIDTEEELHRLQKSKYFQSYMGNVMRNISKYLDDGREVLFCGTPCQVAGVKKYLGKSYSNLILIDLLCAQCPSKQFFAKYLNENYNIKDIKKYDFRYKSEDDKLWNANSVKITDKDANIKIKTRKEDDYLQVYHTGSLALSSQCLKCKYQGSTRVGDLTIGDCWGIESYDSMIDVSKGVSAILVNNEKGEHILQSIPKQLIGVLKEEPLEQIKKYNVLAFIEKRDWPNTPKRKKFLEDVLEYSFKEAKEFSTSVLPVNELEIKYSDKNSLELTWEQNVDAEGYIIEQYKESMWERIARIEGNHITAYRINDLLSSETYKFRICAFVLIGRTPYYSPYQEITGTTY